MVIGNQDANNDSDEKKNQLTAIIIKNRFGD